MSAEHDPVSIGVYKVERLIGRAGQTAVYRCLDPRSQRPVAVKLFPRRLSADAELSARFRQEIEALQKLTRFPGLVQVLACGQEGDRLFVATEWVEGSSLDRLLQGRRLLLPEVFAVMKGICRALAWAHAPAQGRVHGALTPRNVLVSPDLKSVKLANLGLAPFEAGTAPSLTSTLSTGEIRLGALYYLAPEALEGAGSSGPQADLYSAGAIFHEMLTGRPAGAHFDLPSQLDAGLPQEVDPLPLKCLARRPEDRYPSAAALLAEIERVEEDLRLRLLSEIRGVTLSGTRNGGAARSEASERSKPKRSPLLYLGIVSAVLLGLGILGFLMMR